MVENEMFSLANKAILVTGGAQGIGYAISEALVRSGASVSICDIDIALAEESAEKLQSLTDQKVIAIKADVSDPIDAEKMVAATVEKLGSLDVCFANAGIAEPDLPILDFEDYGFDLWNKLLEVNLTGVYLTDIAAAKYMRKQKRGNIINTCSIVGFVADAEYGCIGYSAAKGGVLQLTKQLASMMANDGIRVNGIAPGYVETGLSNAEDPGNTDPQVLKLREATMFRTPLKRYAQPAELAGMAVFLASDASSYCTGTTYPIDGGWLSV